MNIFNYDSKFNQILMVAADMMIVNFLYVICSIPIFTMGAAQAGLYTAMKVLRDPEDDSSVAKAFFRGFGSGFWKITAVHVIFCVLFYLMATGVTTSFQLYTHQQGSLLPLIISALGFCTVAVFHAMLAPVHASFDCTPGQLLRNDILMTLAHPVASLVSALLGWVPPLAGLVVGLHFLMSMTPVICAIYYSFAYMIIFTLMKKPFESLKKTLKEQGKVPAEEDENGAVPAQEPIFRDTPETEK